MNDQTTVELCKIDSTAEYCKNHFTPLSLMS